MRFIALLVLLLLGAGIFFVLAFILKKRIRKLAIGFGILGLMVSLFIFGLWLADAGGWQKEAVYTQVNYGLSDTTLQNFVRRQEDIKEPAVLMMSLASTGLRKAVDDFPEDKGKIIYQLTWMADYVSDERLFEIWQNRTGWEQQAFFLAHAGIVLSNYQAVSQNDEHQEQLSRICRFLAASITRSRYKHLASRPGDSALRPHDNAAALVALRQYDELLGEDLAPKAIEDWTNYIEKELQYEDTHLPCAGFTATNRCRLKSVGGSLAMLSAYTAEADLAISKTFWQDFRFYYKEAFFNLLGNIKIVADESVMPEFCDFSTHPLPCDGYQHVYAIYAAANRGDWVTYYQLNNGLIIDDFLHPPNKLWSEPVQNQVMGLIKLSARLCASTTNR